MADHEMTYEVRDPSGKVWRTFEKWVDAAEYAEEQAAKKLEFAIFTRNRSDSGTPPPS